MSVETTFIFKLPITSKNSTFVYSFAMSHLNMISEIIGKSKCLLTTWLCARKFRHVLSDVTPYLGLYQKLLATMFTLKWLGMVVDHVLTIILPVELMRQQWTRRYDTFKPVMLERMSFEIIMRVKALSTCFTTIVPDTVGFLFFYSDLMPAESPRCVE